MSPSSYQSSSSPPPNLVGLAAELVAMMIPHLPNRDIKNLRLTCRILCDRAPLRLDRVYLSPNPRNIEVFRAIADHETLRLGIGEIIWDDAPLAHDRVEMMTRDESVDFDTESPWGEWGDLPKGVPQWFAEGCWNSLNDTRFACSNGYDEDWPHHVARKQEMDAQLPLDTCWEYYQHLLLQQEEVLASDADADALRYGLGRFPSLKRVTITPAAHGYLFAPFYETPMIRAFPYGFIYLIPRGWPTPRLNHPPYRAPPWNDVAEKRKWRGFCIVTRELSIQDHNVSDLVLDVAQLNTGLNCHVFDQPNEEYDNLVILLRKPGFRRIDLALLCDSQEYEGWPSLRSGYLHRALSEATDLQHVSLRTQVAVDQFLDGFDPDEDFTPLRTILPVEKWQNLRHFGLSLVLVKQDDLISLLGLLPATLRSVELSFLTFLGESGDYRELLPAMRDRLSWHERAVGERPSVEIFAWMETGTGVWDHRFVWLKDEVSGFLYGNGENPFRGLSGCDPNVPMYGVGIERDLFEPALDRPYQGFGQ